MVKQVIVVRTDLDMPIGRIPAQVAHASVAVLLDMGKWNGDDFTIKNAPQDVRYWMEKSFTKIVVKVHSEKELADLKEKADKAKLPNALISDNIGSEMHTMALAIGPATAIVLDSITGHLKLL